MDLWTKSAKSLKAPIQAQGLLTIMFINFRFDLRQDAFSNPVVFIQASTSTLGARMKRCVVQRHRRYSSEPQFVIMRPAENVDVIPQLTSALRAKFEGNRLTLLSSRPD